MSFLRTDRNDAVRRIDDILEAQNNYQGEYDMNFFTSITLIFVSTS